MSAFDPQAFLAGLSPEGLQSLLTELTRRALRDTDADQDALCYSLDHTHAVDIFNYTSEEGWTTVLVAELLMDDEEFKEWQSNEEAREVEAQAKREAEEALRLEKQNAQFLQDAIDKAQISRDSASRRASRAQELADASLAEAETELLRLKSKRSSYPNVQYLFES